MNTYLDSIKGINLHIFLSDALRLATKQQTDVTKAVFPQQPKPWRILSSISSLHKGWRSSAINTYQPSLNVCFVHKCHNRAGFLFSIFTIKLYLKYGKVCVWRMCETSESSSTRLQGAMEWNSSCCSVQITKHLGIFEWAIWPHISILLPVKSHCISYSIQPSFGIRVAHICNDIM